MKLLTDEHQLSESGSPPADWEVGFTTSPLNALRPLYQLDPIDEDTPTNHGGSATGFWRSFLDEARRNRLLGQATGTTAPVNTQPVQAANPWNVTPLAKDRREQVARDNPAAGLEQEPALEGARHEVDNSEEPAAPAIPPFQLSANFEFFQNDTVERYEDEVKAWEERHRK
ncbi:hypothetical protein LTS08_006676 [Lithohypha guttulata]|nr:hypothetical protein LTS08_006676 [Lithohypha guttulata]